MSDTNKIVDMIISRIDRFEKETNKKFEIQEKKIDMILSWKWKIAGGSIAAIFLFNQIIKIVK